jgi:hypothetical protein
MSCLAQTLCSVGSERSEFPRVARTSYNSVCLGQSEDDLFLQICFPILNDRGRGGGGGAGGEGVSMLPIS